MPDLIDRTALMKTLDEDLDVFKHAQELIRLRIIQATAVDAAPVVHGRWIGEYDEATQTRECSVCHKLRTPDNYCSNCGAKMGGEPT